jgi:hypothetical protein
MGEGSQVQQARVLLAGCHPPNACPTLRVGVGLAQASAHTHTFLSSSSHVARLQRPKPPDLVQSSFINVHHTALHDLLRSQKPKADLLTARHRDSQQPGRPRHFGQAVALHLAWHGRLLVGRLGAYGGRNCLRRRWLSLPHAALLHPLGGNPRLHQRLPSPPQQCPIEGGKTVAIKLRNVFARLY